MHSHSAADYSQWDQPVYRWQSLNRFLQEGAFRKGIHCVAFPDGLVDLWVHSDMAQPSATPTVAVILSGATPPRGGTRGPYLSGQQLASELRIPTVSLADPTVTDHDDLGLAWYSGCDEFSAASAVRRLLAGIADYLQCHLLLVGGSGGGFAGLRLAEELGPRATALVWNPQTDILKYQPAAVAQYLAGAYSSLGLDDQPVGSVQQIEATRARLESIGVTTAVGSNAHARCLILQNASDWHVDSHTRPYAERRGLQVAGTAMSDADGTIALGNWGDGHVPPPRDVLLTSVRSLLAGASPAATYLTLREQFPLIFSLEVHPVAEIGLENFKASVFEGTVQVEFNGDATGLQFAYYFNGPDGRMDQQWYTDTPVVIVPVHLSERATSVSCFVRNELGEKVRFEVSLPPVPGQS